MNITLYDIAMRFVGTKEVPGTTADNSQILAMLLLDQPWPKGEEVPWCSAFLNYCAWLLRLPRSKSLMARSWLSIGRPILYPMQKFQNQPEVGYDVVILRTKAADEKSGHVGLFSGWQDFRGAREPGEDPEIEHPDTVLILGGNQSNQVSMAQYPTDRILGIRRLYEE